jgi:hypothetical protein
MNTTETTPKTLDDLQYMNHVLAITVAMSKIESQSKNYFLCVMCDNRNVTCRKIFTDSGYTVYECYTDSGSEDYLYIINR